MESTKGNLPYLFINSDCSCSIGFVEFFKEDDAASALNEMNNKPLKGREIHI